MTNFIFGYTSVTVGALYLVLATWVLREIRSSRGPLAIGFIAAFTTCAIHHLLHAHHLLGGYVEADLAEGLSMIGSMIPSALYLRFRFNAAIGRPADQELDGVSSRAIGLLVASIAASGGFMVWVVTRAAGRFGELDAWALGPGLATFTAFLAVSWILAMAQVRRFRTDGVVSASAIAFTALFFTCSLSHFAYAFGRVETDWHMAVGDAAGVVGSASLLTIVAGLRRANHRRYASTVGGARVRDTRVTPPWVSAG